MHCIDTRFTGDHVEEVKHKSIRQQSVSVPRRTRRNEEVYHQKKKIVNIANIQTFFVCFVLFNESQMVAVTRPTVASQIVQ
jgi:hypothetical protein